MNVYHGDIVDKYLHVADHVHTVTCVMNWYTYTTPYSACTVHILYTYHLNCMYRNLRKFCAKKFRVKMKVLMKVKNLSRQKS